MMMHPMLAGLETPCVSSPMYYDVADRVLEHAATSNHVGQRIVFLAARNYGCTLNALPAAVTNIRMTTDDGEAAANSTRDDLYLGFDACRGSQSSVRALNAEELCLLAVIVLAYYCKLSLHDGTR